MPRRLATLTRIDADVRPLIAGGTQNLLGMHGRTVRVRRLAFSGCDPSQLIVRSITIHRSANALAMSIPGDVLGNLDLAGQLPLWIAGTELAVEVTALSDVNVSVRVFGDEIDGPVALRALARDIHEAIG